MIFLYMYLPLTTSRLILFRLAGETWPSTPTSTASDDDDGNLTEADEKMLLSAGAVKMLMLEEVAAVVL